MFVIEESLDGLTNWTSVGMTTKSKITLSGYTPGETRYFRLFAERSERVSSYSEPVVIWPGGGESSLALAA